MRNHGAWTIACLSWAAATVGAAAPGDLDPTFGNHSMVVTKSGNDVMPPDAAHEPDGKPFSPGAATESLTSFRTLYRFRGGTDGIGPNGVVLDKAGNLFGSTAAGGETSCPLNGSPGCGLVFELNVAGRETVLHRFSGNAPDEGGSFGSVILDAAGNLYGTTSGLPLFGGTVFTVEKGGQQTVLYSFTGGADGGNPEAGLIQDAAGNLYGTTVFGGAFDQGVVFRLDTVGVESVLHSFKGAGDGTNTRASLIRDAAGNLYGTASGGGSFRGPCIGSGCGTVFKLAPNGKLTVLHTFTGGSDGASPLALVRDAAGNLFGTASSGGDPDCTVGEVFGCGLLFRLDAKDKLTVLHTFTDGFDGASPNTGLVQDAAGNLYGTTELGGASGKGVVFKLDVTGKLTVLHAFTGGSDGGNPDSVVLDGAGHLYGTAATGGGRCRDQGCGAVFKITL
jgi:uncharacterized repeat protein (TIGR03803 family)